jgi:diguanylate cyclase (GGDEF)-like protein
MSNVSDKEDHLQEKATILIVDDQPLNLQVMSAILAPFYDVLAATTGAKAIEICRRSMPDLILMDVIMPSQNGLDVCRELKADPELAGVPIIFVTGLDTDEEENSCWRAGGVDFIKKPVNAMTLKHRVHAHLKLKFQSDLLRDMAFVDGLTGVYNRRHFNACYEREVKVAVRSGRELAVALIDIDFFKQYNDQHGHLAGDDCLRSVARSMRNVMRRPNDVFARYGGEEFACIFPETSRLGAELMANKMLNAIRDAGIKHEGSELGFVTVSIGVAYIAGNKIETPQDLLAVADERLYCAKKEGRNRIIVD